MTAYAWSKACIVFYSSNTGIAASKPSPGKKEYTSMGLSRLCVVLCTYEQWDRGIICPRIRIKRRNTIHKPRIAAQVCSTTDRSDKFTPKILGSSTEL